MPPSDFASGAGCANENVPLKPESNYISSLLRKARARAAYFLKTCLLSALPVLLPNQAAQADSPPIELLNAGLNDAWVSTDAPFQGMFITVFPELELVFLAWFTFDTVVPEGESAANLISGLQSRASGSGAFTKSSAGFAAVFGADAQRWVTALGSIDGNKAELNAELTSGGVFNTSDPMPTQDTNYGTISLDFVSCEEATVNFNFPATGETGAFIINRVVPDNTALCEALVPPPSCTRADPDISHGLDNPPIVNDATIPTDEVVGAGPGPDGIPPLELPGFIQEPGANIIDPSELVVGVKIDNDIRAYSHRVLNWHEVMNDQFLMDGLPERATLSYCPLTGSATLWKSLLEPLDKTFGTSGLLYNSNLIMYDRETLSFWSQMLEQSVNGSQILTIPDRLQVVETTWGTWKSMYPGTRLISENTGFSRDYNDYPYGSYRTDNSLLFPANNSNDNRLYRKERVVGIDVGDRSRVYPISNFSSNVEVINETVGDMHVVAAGSSGHNFGVVFNRELEDCTVLEFQPVQDQLPVVMLDNEGNEWDIFGKAVSGARTGQQLQKTNSYIAYWFAWTAFSPGAEIHQ